MPEEITISIDGREIKTTSDKVVVQAANDAGVYIPYLCYHPGMKPYGACRMCVVQVEGAPGTPASCTLPVRDGMVIHTQGEETTAVRDTILDLLLSEHPHGCLTCHRVDLCGPQDICLRHVDVTDRCVTCPKNERCELKDTTRYHTQGLNSPLTYQYRDLQIETKDPFYDRDYNLCIVCARCTRVCDEVRGDVAIGMTERAGQVLVGTSMGDSLLESGCEFCGACIDVCPVGALVETDFKWERMERTEKSVCNGCPVGCQMTYEVNKWEKVIRVIPELNAPSNHGQGCYIGKFGFKHVNDKRRLKTPLIRRNGTLEEASWDEALTVVADGFKGHTGDSFALIASSRNTNEELYVAQKFARVAMGTNNVNVSSNDRPEVLQGLMDVLGYGAGTMPLWDIGSAACVLIVDANVTERQNVVAVPIKQAVRAGTQKLIVIDSREVELTRYAHLWLRPYPGMDSIVLGGMLRVIFDEDLLDKTSSAVAGLDIGRIRSALDEFSLEAASRESGVSAEKIIQAARLLAESETSVIAFALDTCLQALRRSASQTIANLALLTGNIGKPSCGILPLLLGSNDQGAWDMGCVPHLLPGHVMTSDTTANDRIGKQWSRPVPEIPGMSLQETFDRARAGHMQAMFVLGDHPTFHDGTYGDIAGSFSNVDFLVVSETFLTPLSSHADVVLPATTWLEKSGTYTNLERRVQPLRRVIDDRKGEARDEGTVMCEIATMMGVSGFEFSKSEDVLDEAASLIPAYRGISYARLMDELFDAQKPSGENPLPTQVMYSEDVSNGIQWPCVSTADSGTSILYQDGWSGRTDHPFEPVWAERPRPVKSEFPLIMVHGRVLSQADRPIEIISNGKLNTISRTEQLFISPSDAEYYRLSEGENIKLISLQGEIHRGEVHISEESPDGVISITTLFGELALALDASEMPDPMNQMPRLGLQHVRLERDSG